MILCIFAPQNSKMPLTTNKFDINPVKSSRVNSVDFDNLVFGKTFSDHMLIMDYKNDEWQKGRIVPFDSITMHPATSVIHYGQSIFEGMKANKTIDGEVNLFRPEMNAKRFALSAKRMCMPALPENIFVDSIKALLDLDRNWVPNNEVSSLYIRPFMFATDPLVGIKPSSTYSFMIITSPVGAYYSHPVRVKIEENFTRAAIGGVGRAKAAGNYAAALYPSKLAQEEGFHQLLWTDAVEHKYIEESGTMNVVFQIDGKLVSPSEESDTILRGITKRSVLEIAKSWGVEVEERPVLISEIIAASNDGTLQDAFGVGTAATLTHIGEIGYRDQLFTLPEVETRELSNKLKTYLNDLKLGKVEDTFAWCQRV